MNQQFGQNWEDLDPLVSLAKLLLQRLERISADSTWAHRASGTRGAIMRLLDKAETAPESFSSSSKQNLEELVMAGFHIVTESAKEIEASDTH